MTPEPSPLTHDLDEFDPEDIKEAARTYAESFAFRGMISEAAVLHGLLKHIETLERSHDA